MDTDLLRMEIFGVRLDREFYSSCINAFDEAMKDAFGNFVYKTEEINRFEDRGFFYLKYTYIPLNYQIVIENEMRIFTITFYDEEMAYNHLSRICKFDNTLEKNCINNAIEILKNVLEKNNFNMYFYKEDKLYRKNSEGIKRVKDIRELLNG